MNEFLPPLGDRSHHFTTEQVMEAIGGNSTDYAYRRIKARLHLMTSGERYTLYRAIKKLVLDGESKAEQRGKEEGLRLAKLAYEAHVLQAKYEDGKLTDFCNHCGQYYLADIHLRSGETRESRIEQLFRITAALLPAAQPAEAGTPPKKGL